MKPWIVIVWVALVACNKTDAPTTAPTAPVKKTVDSPEKPTLKQQREAFGIQLPPDAYDIARSDYTVEAYTRLTLPEVEKFYEGKLPDYEKLSLRRMTLWEPLYEHLPKLTANQVEFSAPTRLRFDLKRPRAKAEEIKNYRVGDPVDYRMPDGELLAPGAVYGEPYTPPPGSPLADKRYKSNWGKPFGTWVPQ